MLSLVILIISIFFVVALSPRILSATFGKGTANSTTVVIWAVAITAIIVIKFLI